MEKRLYHVVRVNDKTGIVVHMTGVPLTHDQAITLLSKVPTWPQFPQLRTIIEQV